MITFGAREKVLSETKEGNICYFEADEKNRVGAVFNEKGQILETLEYDKFGVLVRSEAGKIEDSTVSYTGYEYEESTGLYYAKARYYQAEDGRFLSEDAYHGNTSEEGNWNRYVYVKNNPIRYWDPSGNIAIELVTIGLLLLVVGLSGAVILVVKNGETYKSQEWSINDLRSKKGEKEYGGKLKRRKRRLRGRVARA